MRAADILPQALELSSDERTQLAALLLDSVEMAENDDGDVEAAWAEEIARRLDDHEQGRTRAIPAEVVFAEARSQLKRSHG